MTAIGRIDVDPAAGDEELTTARAGDRAARWEALAACRAYLSLVVRRNDWLCRQVGLAGSDLIQSTILRAAGGSS